MRTPPDSSDPLRLEVTLLAGTDPAPASPTVDGGSTGAYTVVVATGDAELNRYVAGCLTEDPRLQVHVPALGESAPDAVRRLTPGLLISAPGALNPPPFLLAVSLLLIIEERHEQDAWPAAPGRAIGFLLQPISARRLKDAVDRLRGAAADRDAPPA